jgi:hypothetical protein
MKKTLVLIAFAFVIGIPSAYAQQALPGDNPGINSITGTGSPTPGTFAAQGSGGINPSYLQGYSNSIIGIINRMFVPVLIAIAFITFLWGVYKYFILGAESDTERATGRQFVLWGIIGLVVIFSVWTLVNIVSGTLGFPTGGLAPRPPLI